MVKVGTSSGKGFGMTDEEMSKTYRTQRRKGTSQPKDRLSDHMVIMKNGPNANMIVKNLANSVEKVASCPSTFPSLFLASKKL